MSLDQSAAFVKCETGTLDAFLGGRLHLLQPARGFRAGLDSVLLGVSVAPETATILDLGAGAGTAALCALAHDARRVAALAENHAEMAALARRNIAENGLAGRAHVVEVDVTATGRAREAAGLKRDYYTSVLANPPYFDAGGGTRAPEQVRAAARHMPGADLDKWVKTAAACAAPHGEAIFIYRADGLAQLLQAFSARFGAVTVLPLAPRPGQDALRVLVRGIKGSRAPMVLKSPFVMHEAKGRAFTPQADAIFRGRDVLHW